jgi:hypothetical protein
MAVHRLLGAGRCVARRRPRRVTLERLEDRLVLDAAQVTTYTTAEQFKLGTYTVDADFDKGVLFNLNHDDVANQLQLNARLSTFPVMWIANAGEDSLSKWDTSTNKEVARYFTSFSPGQPGYVNHLGSAYSGAAPSRTAVDRDGNVYVANRHFDGKQAEVIKILASGGIDRNGNGKIDTSFDLNADGNIGDSAGHYDDGEILPMADTNGNGVIDPDEIQDERIAWVARAGQPGGLGRSLAIDPNGDIWLGIYHEQAYYKLSGATGQILAGPIATPGHSPYGAQVDGNGILWGASLGTTLLKLNTLTQEVKVYNHAAQGADYGIAIGNGKVYMASQGSHSFVQFDPATETFSTPAAEKFFSLGVAVDRDGNIVVGKNSGGVAKFRPDGSVIWSVPGQPGTSDVRGTVVDSNNDVWLISLNSNTLAKHAGTDGAPLGVFASGNQPYTYTDATGLTRFTSTNPSGRWTVVQDSGTPGQVWHSILWNQEPEGRVPEGTSLIVEARAADSRDALETLPFTAVANGASPGVTGRFIEVRVTLNANANLVSPILSDITIAAQAIEPPLGERPAPRVASFARLGIHAHPTLLVLAFTEPLNPTTARNLANFQVVCRGPDGRFGTPDDGIQRIRSAVYDPQAQTVTLRMRHPLSLRRTFRLTALGTTETGLRGTNGKPLDGQANGLGGSDYIHLITRADLRDNPTTTRKPATMTQPSVITPTPPTVLPTTPKPRKAQPRAR